METIDSKRSVQPYKIQSFVLHWNLNIRINSLIAPLYLGNYRKVLKHFMVQRNNHEKLNNTISDLALITYVWIYVSAKNTV